MKVNRRNFGKLAMAALFGQGLFGPNRVYGAGSASQLDRFGGWTGKKFKATGFFRTEHDQMQQKTEKALQHKVLYEATVEHPAQIEKYTLDKGVAKITTTRLSGMVSPATKARCSSSARPAS